jgi:hypothetical protein
MPAVLQPKATYTYDPGNDASPMANGKGMSKLKNPNTPEAAFGHLNFAHFFIITNSSLVI